jgi:cytochrome c553
MSTNTMNKGLLGIALSAAMIRVTSFSSAAAERVDELTVDALGLDANVRRGAALYRQECAGCHGPGAQGAAQHDIPALASQRRAYIIRQLAAFIERDRTAMQMHKVVSREAVSDPQAWADLALFLNNLPPPKSVQTGDGKYLSLGEASYEQFCISCHEEDGRGDDDGFVPSVRNQHYPYLLKEMRKIAAGHRFNVESDSSRFFNSLDADEMQGLADYMSRMQGPVRDRARMNDDGTVND